MISLSNEQARQLDEDISELREYIKGRDEWAIRYNWRTRSPKATPILDPPCGILPESSSSQ